MAKVEMQGFTIHNVEPCPKCAGEEYAQLQRFPRIYEICCNKCNHIAGGSVYLKGHLDLNENRKEFILMTRNLFNVWNEYVAKDADRQPKRVRIINETSNPRKRYRYILNGMVLGADTIKGYRLIAANNMTSDYKHVAIRVNIPDDMELTKWSCDPYSITDDERTLDELGYDVLIWNKKTKKWKVHNEWKGTMPSDIPLRFSDI